MTSQPEKSDIYGIFVITCVSDVAPEASRDRIIARTPGAALDAYCPSPAHGAKFTVEVVGNGRVVE
jgi:hypothetical protein